jgi:hypothetical protein
MKATDVASELRPPRHDRVCDRSDERNSEWPQRIGRADIDCTGGDLKTAGEPRDEAPKRANASNYE